MRRSGVIAEDRAALTVDVDDRPGPGGDGLDGVDARRLEPVADEVADDAQLESDRGPCFAWVQPAGV